jgi:hypothetical protein
MRRCLKLASPLALFLLAVSLSASAGSTDSFSNVSLTGVSGTVSGSFTFNSSSDTFSAISLSFNGGVFGGVNAQNGGGNGSCILGVCGFSWQAQLANGNWVWDTILLNLKTGQYQDLGGIYNWKNGGNFNYLSVPEGDAPLSYLLLSGFAMLAGILISGKHRRTARLAESS